MSDIPQPPGNSMADPTGSTGGATVRLEPITENIIVPVPWYKRLFSAPQVQTQTVWRLSVVAILVVGVLIGRQMQAGLTVPTSTRVEAAVGKARVSIYPLETKIPPEKSFQLWMTTDQDVALAEIIISFDPKAIQLSKEVTVERLTDSDITFTSWTQANKTGEMTFTMQPKTGGASIAPGTKQFGTFYFTVAKGSQAATANIMISEEKTKVTGPDAVPFLLTTTNASVGLK